MKLKLKKNQILVLAVILGLILLLPFVLSLTRQRQEIRKKAAGSGAVKISLYSPKTELTAGEIVDIQIRLTSTQAVLVNAVGVDLQYNTAFFAFPSSIDCGTTFPTKAKGVVDGNKIYVSCGIQEGGTDVSLSPNQPYTLATLHVTVNSTDLPSSQITFLRTKVTDENGGDISDAGTPATYTIGAAATTTPGPTITPVSTVTPTPTATITPKPTPSPTGGITGTPTPTVTPGATGTPTPTGTITPGQVQIRFKIKFAGVETQKPDQKVKVWVNSGFLNSTLAIYDNVNVTAVNTSTDAALPNWVYQSEILTLPTEFDSQINEYNGYYLLIKGPKHLATRYCSSVNQNRPCSLPQIKISGLCLGFGCYSGIYEFDFTGYPLPAGDLPLTQTGGQDGVVNSIDAVALTNCFETPTDAACIAKADLNFDDIITSADTIIMNNSIYTRWEDD
jgi:hypothetical protein